jgi:hypothetical protein
LTCAARVLGLAATLVAGAAGCGGDDASPFVTLMPDPGFPGTAGDPAKHADLFAFQPVPTCQVANPIQLDRAVALRIFRGPDVPDSQLKEMLGGLQRYYSQYGVTLSTAYDVINIPVREAMVMDMGQITARVKADTGVASLDDNTINALPQAKQDEVLAALGAAIMHNMRELLRVYSQPRRPEINVVVLPDMVTDNLAPDLAQFRGLLGLGVSPELLAMFPADDPSSGLYKWLDVQDQFTPMAVVGVKPINRFLRYPDIAIAHELGHTFGLAHVQTMGNLLHQGDLACNLTLDDTQLAHVGTAATAAADTIDLEALSLTTRAGEFVRAVEAMLFPHGRKPRVDVTP